MKPQKKGMVNMTKEQIMTALYEMIINQSEERKVESWNKYCIDTNQFNKVIHFNSADDLNAFFETPAQALEAVAYDDSYSYGNYYFTYDEFYGLSSFDFLGDENSPYDIDELVSYFMTAFD